MTKLEIGDVCRHGHVIEQGNIYTRLVNGTLCLRCRTCQRGGSSRYFNSVGKVRASVRNARRWRADIEESRRIARDKKRAEYVNKRAVILARSNAWAKANRDKRRRYASQPHIRLHSNVSRAIRSSIRLNKAGRGWELLVGYTRSQLVAHLEQLFTDGMTWSNYGRWEIDHIRPRSSFRFTSPDDSEFHECWALSNLQPLWMADNRSKGAKVAA